MAQLTHSTLATVTLAALAAGCAASSPRAAAQPGVAERTQLTTPLLAGADPAPRGCAEARIRLATQERYEDALVALEAQCGDERAQSCLAAGEMHLAGCGTDADATSAASAFERGCELGEARACGELGILAATDRAGALWSREVAKHLLHACDHGHAAACRQLAMLLEEGERIPRDTEMAKELYDRGCRLGDAPACRLGAHSHLSTASENPRDVHRAVQMMKRACMQSADTSSVCSAATPPR